MDTPSCSLPAPNTSHSSAHLSTISSSTTYKTQPNLPLPAGLFVCLICQPGLLFCLLKNYFCTSSSFCSWFLSPTLTNSASWLRFEQVTRYINVRFTRFSLLSSQRWLSSKGNLIEISADIPTLPKGWKLLVKLKCWIEFIEMSKYDILKGQMLSGHLIIGCICIRELALNHEASNDFSILYRV